MDRRRRTAVAAYMAALKIMPPGRACLLLGALAAPALAAPSLRDVGPAADQATADTADGVVIESRAVLAPEEDGSIALSDSTGTPLTITVENLSLPTDIQDLIDYLSEGYLQPVTELTLEQAIAVALEHNHDLNSKRLSAAAACRSYCPEPAWASNTRSGGGLRCRASRTSSNTTCLTTSA